MSFSRVRGSLVAGVVGDCFGRLFEGSSYVSMKDVLIEVNRTERTWTDIQKKRAEGKTGRAIRQAEYTDDTAMARSIAASLVEEKSVNIEDIAARFAESYSKQPNRGYGGNVVTVLEALSGPDLKDIYKPARDQFNGTGSYGNGGAMRISPLGLFFHKQSLDELKEKTVDITRLTHSHRHAIVGALLQSFAVHLALSLDNGKRLDAAAFLSHLLQHLKPVEEEVYLNHRNLAAPVACDDDRWGTVRVVCVGQVGGSEGGVCRTGGW
ncbi:ADP-ribosylhydrolase ARH3-like [Babylonia areolata]|uniref:ADP-ribosylhydrolase ARH3-like n=1 Tax=Babylonia areolata TaxID=304850 RepID=UPI003FD20D0F